MKATLIDDIYNYICDIYFTKDNSEFVFVYDFDRTLVSMDRYFQYVYTNNFNTSIKSNLGWEATISGYGIDIECLIGCLIITDRITIDMLLLLNV